MPQYYSLSIVNIFSELIDLSVYQALSYRRINLEGNHSRGDVMIEARDKDKDRALKGAFREIFIHGTSYIPSKRFQSVLTSKEIKIKPKEANIYGLQLADIVAYPSYAGIKNQHLKQEVPDNFGGLIFEIMNDEKYYRVSNRIWGLGKNWLP